jgi:hypothetical protein
MGPGIDWQKALQHRAWDQGLTGRRPCSTVHGCDTIDNAEDEVLQPARRCDLTTDVMVLQEGEVRTIDIPPHEAYGTKGCPEWDIPPNARLVFEIEVCMHVLYANSLVGDRGLGFRF